MYYCIHTTQQSCWESCRRAFTKFGKKIIALCAESVNRENTGWYGQLRRDIRYLYAYYDKFVAVLMHLDFTTSFHLVVFDFYELCAEINHFVNDWISPG